MARKQAYLTCDLYYVTRALVTVYVKAFSLSLDIEVGDLMCSLHSVTVVRVTYDLLSSREASVFPPCLEPSLFRA